jgi:hypothetical protein
MRGVRQERSSRRRHSAEGGLSPGGLSPAIAALPQPTVIVSRQNPGMALLSEPTDYQKAVAILMAELSAAKQAQINEFALFLRARSKARADGETREIVEGDEALWDAQFAATSDDAFGKLIAEVEDEITAGKTKPMFDTKGRIGRRR